MYSEKESLYKRFQLPEKWNKSLRLVFEVIYKFYQVSQKVPQITFWFRNNLLSHTLLQSKLLEEGVYSDLNKYLLFYSQLSTEERILTQEIETSKPSFMGGFTCKLSEPGAEKLFIKVSHTSKFDDRFAQMELTSDPEGKHSLALLNQNQITKRSAFQNVYFDSVYMHYPVYHN